MRGGPRGARPTDDRRWPHRGHRPTHAYGETQSVDPGRRKTRLTRTRQSFRPLHPGAWITIALLAACLVASLFVVRWLEIRRLDAELAALQSEQQLALTRQDELRSQLELQDDPETLEEHARAELGLVKPGEEKVIFVEVEEQED